MRQKHVASCRLNGDNSHHHIANLYSDSAHFIYELLQNADDAEATEASFTLNKSALCFEHNGSRIFSFEDIDSITKIGSSTKKDDANAIGKFGAGFKSVFTVTNSPRVHSEDWHFQIVDFIVPEEIADLPGRKQGWTRFELPFNKPDVSTSDTFARLAERLRGLESESLLFLHNIECIQWSTGSDHGLYLRTESDHKATISTQVNDQTLLDKEYVVFNSIIHIGSTDLRLVVAYRLDVNGQIEQVRDSKLFVFFPTNEPTGFHFLVHAPYKTTPSRETIPFEDTENNAITEGLAILIADSIDLLKDKGLLNQQAYAALPIERDQSHPLYSAAYEQVKWRLLTEPLLLTSNGIYVRAKDARIPVHETLPRLLDEDDILNIFDQKLFWVADELLSTYRMRDYIEQILEIPGITLQDFCASASSDFYESKPDEWLIGFYESMQQCEEIGYSSFSLFKAKLQEYPILRLQDNSHRALRKAHSGLPQVYLPSRGESRFPTIKRSVALSKQAHEFLLALGLREPDNIAEVRDLILPKYRDTSINLDNYLLDIQRIYEIWSMSEKTQKDELLELLKSDQSQFVRCLDSSGNVTYRAARDVYFHTKKLAMWFAGNDQDEFGFLHFPENRLTKQVRELFEATGVRYGLKIEGSHPVNIEHPGYMYFKSIDGFNKDFNIEGLECALANITPQRSYFLWDLLLEHTNSLKGRYMQRKRKKDDWEEGPEEESVAYKQLSAHPWLYLKNEQLIKSNIGRYSLNDLAEGYRLDKDVHRLVEVLGLKPDEIHEIERKYGGKFITSVEWNELEEYRRSKTKEDDRIEIESSGTTLANEDDPAWAPKINPDAAAIIEDAPYSRNKHVRDLSDQGATKSSLNAEEAVEDNNIGKASHEPKHHTLNARDIKAIGEHGEKLAKRYLLQAHPDKQVVWLNEHGNQGIGYDFVVREANRDLLYYEVKSKTDKSPKHFEISGVQWDWAKQLYKEGRGDNYVILLVSDVGETHPVISTIADPYGRWLDGELDADPVCIEL